MTAVVVALADEERGRSLAAELALEDVTILEVTAPETIDPALLQTADALVITPSRRWITRDLIALCDRAAVRIVAFGDGEARLLARHGLAPALPRAPRDGASPKCSAGTCPAPDRRSRNRARPG
ncbi:hypothetical protein L2X99_08000 [Microbacterium sp. KUDC0406]|uniref:hypothetical protein n=1 Tax=Microbacterium sp. KUDC0406 TaxID=2909588 RepID=UPI001F3DE96C|nr:hypothetical protein [Microbacterium sp. KUDC0406]UJP11436.1 hypothetical protein L2X99_08000 [Microbacterium sp. KUDC0406]